MKRLIRIVAGLYPRSWQERYGAEFAALLDDVNPDWRTSVDILKGALGMQIRGLSFAKILLAAGVAGVLAAAGARFAIPARAEAVIAVSGPVNEASARDAVLSLAKQAFKHASLTAVTKQETLPPRNGTPAFSVAFTYVDPHDGLRAVLAFVREHAGPSAPGELQILTIASRASNHWLIPLIGPGVSVALALALTLTWACSGRVQTRYVDSVFSTTNSTIAIEFRGSTVSNHVRSFRRSTCSSHKFSVSSLQKNK
jgi:hypothetical protein